MGIAVAVALTRLLESILFQVNPFDPLTFLAVPIVLLRVALLASWLLARGYQRDLADVRAMLDRNLVSSAELTAAPDAIRPDLIITGTLFPETSDPEIGTDLYTYHNIRRLALPYSALSLSPSTRYRRFS